MKNILYTSSLIFLVCLNIYFIYSFNKKTKKLKGAQQKIEIAKVKDQNNIYLDSYLPIQLNSELKSYEEILLKNELGQTVKLNNVVDKPTFILRFRSTHCNTCVMQEITLLKEQIRKLKADNTPVLILGEFKNTKDFTIMLSSFHNTSNIKVFEVVEGLENEIDEVPVPYSFIYFPAKKSIGMTFITEKSRPQRSITFYHEVLSKLSSYKKDESTNS